MATMTTGTATLTPELRTFYDRNLLSRLLPRLVWALFGQPKSMPAHEGQTVNFRRFSSLAAATTPLDEGVTPTGSELTVTQLTCTPEQYGDYIKISDILDFTAPDPVLVEGGTLMGEQAADTIDQLVRDVLAAGLTVQYVLPRTSRVTIAATDYLTTAAIQIAVRTMKTNKAKAITQILNASTGVGTKPVNAGYVGIIGPSTEYDLKTESGGRWQSVHEYSNNTALFPFEVGAIDEVRFVLTNNPIIFVGEGVGGTVDVHAAIILAADAFGVVQPKGVETIVKDFGQGGDDPLNQRATAGWKMFMKAVILQQLAILRIEHAVKA